MLHKAVVALALILPAMLLAQQAPVPAKTASTSGSTPTRAEVLRLFRAMRLQQQMETIQKMMVAQMPAMVEKTEDEELKSLTPEQRERMRQLAQSSMEDANKLYPVSEMLDDFVPIYQHNLSSSEVQRITAFYLSPAGQKLLNQNPKMMQEAMTVIAPKMQERMLKMIQEEKRKADGAVDAAPAQPQPQNQPPQDQH